MSVCAVAQTNLLNSQLTTATGTDTYSATQAGTFSGLANGYTTRIKFTNANSGASTFNLNSSGAVTLRKSDGTALSSGDIAAGDVKILVYDAGTTQWRITGGGGGSVASVLGTTNRITSTGGANPVIDISATFEALLGKVANPLSQFASTTSAQLRSVLSDEDGTGNFLTTNGSAASLTSFPTFNQNTTGSAASLTTPRTIGIITGDATSAGSSFDGTANNTNALTLATVNSNVGSFGSATQSPAFTVNAKGLITAVSNTTITPAVGSITGLGSGVATWLATPSWTNFNSAITGTAPYVALTGTSTATGTMTLALSTNPWLITSGVTTGTGATAGIQGVFNSITTGNAIDLSSTSNTTGSLIRLTSTSTNSNYTPGTNGLFMLTMSGVNGTASRMNAGIFVSVTNTGSGSPENTAIYAKASGATNNYSIKAEGPFQLIGAGSVLQFSAGGTMQSSGPMVARTVGVNGFDIQTNSLNRISLAGNGKQVHTHSALSSTEVFVTYTQTASSSGSIGGLVWTAAAHTNQTTATEVSDWLLDFSATKELAAGTLANDRTVRIRPRTTAFVSTSTSSRGASLSIEGAVKAGANNTQTFTTGIEVQSVNVGAGTNTSYGGFFNAMTGSTNSFALGTVGDIVLTTTGSKIQIKEGSGGFMGQTALVAGKKAVTVTGVTTSTRCFPALVTPNTTALTTSYQCVCTANTVTLQANVAAGTINTADVSTLNYILFEPAP